MIKKYRPANISEGMWFINRFCIRCQKYDKCNIQYNTMLYDIDEKEYPMEHPYSNIRKLRK